eukprot:CAMPEP_0204130276 /NCGR_PEP_ID=MMETSP0361-20130328/13260_1 /ASSEMBLY_ACC=CAM_ASM_000343 /TAXON_ID=268821 /ORGANISM="Scrippsiella Hangoei, Strain SHTV-5" /LENGTH=177 /DNA_ID=CAMNT_0051082825 /DNA_START=481 /DNA_END=1013 /DNA_ORIENTATION=-
MFIGGNFLLVLLSRVINSSIQSSAGGSKKGSKKMFCSKRSRKASAGSCQAFVAIGFKRCIKSSLKLLTTRGMDIAPSGSTSRATTVVVLSGLCDLLPRTCGGRAAVKLGLRIPRLRVEPDVVAARVLRAGSRLRHDSARPDGLASAAGGVAPGDTAAGTVARDRNAGRPAAAPVTAL